MSCRFPTATTKGATVLAKRLELSLHQMHVWAALLILRKRPHSLRYWYSQSIYACPAYVNESYGSSHVCPPRLGPRFNSRATDMTFLVGLNSIAMQQATATKQTLKATTALLDYAATNPNAKIRYRASDMILQIHSDASYLSEPKAKSRASRLEFKTEFILQT